MGGGKHHRSRWARSRDERGATFVLTAICMVLLLWGGAMGVDIGFTVDSSRQAQALADTVALDLARYINLADNLTVNGGVGVDSYSQYMSQELANAQSDNNATGVTMTATGLYWSTTAPVGWTIPNAAAGQGCYRQLPARNPACTAVLVTAKQNVPSIFAGGSGPVTRSSIAAVTPEDGFSIGSYLVTINSTINGDQADVLNAILGTLGSGASLTFVGYQGLANSYVTVQQLITASDGVLTPSNILTTSLPASSWLTLLTTALGTQQSALNCSSTPTPSVCTAYTALQSLSFGGSSATLCQLVTINGPSCNNGYLSEPGLSTSLDVLQTLTTEAELANGTNAINIQSALGGITGVSSATLSLQVVQPPQIAYGPVGTTANTAQVTADLQLNLGAVGGGILNIPVSGAEGTATLSTITCSETNNSFVSAKLAASTSTATAAVTLGGSSIGSLTISGGSNPSMVFGTVDVPPSASTASSSPPTNPVSFGTTEPSLGYSGTASGLADTLLTSTLQPVLGPILQAAGVSVGDASVADLDDNCGAVSIVK
jgi:uncharacterized membrane protein